MTSFSDKVRVFVKDVREKLRPYAALFIFAARFAFRTAKRCRIEYILTAGVMALAIASLTLSLALTDGIKKRIQSRACAEGHIVVRSAQYAGIADHTAVAAYLAQYRDVVSASARYTLTGVLRSRETVFTASGFGIDPAAERKTLRLERALTAGRYFSAARDEIVLGASAARALKTIPGDMVSVIVRNPDGSFSGMRCTVIGIVYYNDTVRDAFFYTTFEGVSAMHGNQRAPDVIACYARNAFSKYHGYNRMKRDTSLVERSLSITRSDRKPEHSRAVGSAAGTLLGLSGLFALCAVCVMAACSLVITNASRRIINASKLYASPEGALILSAAPVFFSGAAGGIIGLFAALLSFIYTGIWGINLRAVPGIPAELMMTVYPPLTLTVLVTAGIAIVLLPLTSVIPSLLYTNRKNLPAITSVHE
ncbi:MAG: ABC transporter permease [Spirochaetes bacterium]|nr:ABC transporter permease [Spirochaetota bacterium]